MMMGKELWGLKRCSTSTVAESSDPKDDEKPTLQEAERELQNPETDVKKQKKRKKKSKSKQIAEDDNLEPKKKTSEEKEMKKLRKSVKEMTETMKNLQEFFLSKADLPGISMKDLLLTTAPNVSSKEEEEEEPPKKTEKSECCYATEDSVGIDRDSIFVKGFDTSVARDEIKSALWKHFESGGLEVTRVFVPIECKTGVPLGFAFIDVDDNQKALRLGGGYIGGGWFRVMLARNKSECTTFPNFEGCEHCGTFYWERRAKRFLASPWR